MHVIIDGGETHPIVYFCIDFDFHIHYDTPVGPPTARGPCGATVTLKTQSEIAIPEHQEQRYELCASAGSVFEFDGALLISWQPNEDETAFLIQCSNMPRHTTRQVFASAKVA